MEKKTVIKKPRKLLNAPKDAEVLKPPEVKFGYVREQNLMGQRDRISVSIGLDLEVVPYKMKAKPYFNYSSDVGMYNKDETLEEAIERVQGVAVDFINAMKQQIENEKKRHNKKESI